MVVAFRRISASVVDDMIACWRRARLSSDQGKLYYSAINILHAAYYVAGESDHEPIDDPAAEVVQEVVDGMSEEIRTSFEAFHLGIVRGEWCRDKPMKYRALLMAISEETLRARERAGWGIIRDWLDEVKPLENGEYLNGFQ